MHNTAPYELPAGIAPAISREAMAQLPMCRYEGRARVVAMRTELNLGVIARRRGLTQSGVRKLSGFFLGCRVAKGSRTSNWAATILTPSQVAYAATDAWICRELYLHVRELGLLPRQSQQRQLPSR